MNDDSVSARAEKLIEGEPEIPIDAPRDRRAFRISDFWHEGERYVGVRLDVDDDFRNAHDRPGQYVTLSPEDLEPRFLVIATPPNHDGDWEFLVDTETALGAALASEQPGATLEVSPPEGPGFPTDDVADRDVIFFVTGSGIATVPPTLGYWERRADLAPPSVTLYYGESRPRDFAYEDRLARWRRRGHRVVYCDEGAGPQSSDFRYVQHAFAHDDPELDDAVVFVAGAPVMKRHVVETLLDRGVPLDRIVTNV